MDLHGIDYYAHLFQYPSFRYLSSFGRRGDLPKEIAKHNGYLPDGGKYIYVCKRLRDTVIFSIYRVAIS